MQKLKIDELTPHPRNNEFFDDMSGDKWTEFLESIKTRGVIEPVVITQNKVIVSGHQRVRACKELGIDEVLCDVHVYDNEDQVLQDLLETNIRQRGTVGGSAKKEGLRIRELERLYGIYNGGKGSNRYVKNAGKSDDSITQEDLASRLGMSVDSLNNFKILANMIPELDELVDTGIVTKTTALAIMRQLSEEDQIKLISSLDTTKKITQRQAQAYINEINAMRENPPKPDDYDSTKKMLAETQKDYEHLRSSFDAKVSELQELRKKMESMNNADASSQYTKKLKDSSLLFCSRVATFIEQVGGYVWLTQEINKIPELEREGYIRSIHVIKEWADTMENNLSNMMEEK